MEERRGGQGRPRAPSPSSPNWTRRGRPPFLPLSLLLPPSPTPTRKGGSHTPGGSRTPPWRASSWPAASPPYSFIYGGQGAPLDTQVDHKDLSQPCVVPPSTIIHLSHTVAVFRRSPAAVTSSTSSPRHRAEETLPRALLDREFGGRHRAEHVLNAEVPYIRY